MMLDFSDRFWDMIPGAGMLLLEKRLRDSLSQERNVL